MLVISCSQNESTESNIGDLPKYSINEVDSIGISFEQLRFAPQVEIPIHELPDWFIAKIKEMEKEMAPLNYAWVYQGEWNNRTIYYLRDIFSSCLLCEVYYENGEKVAFAVSDVNDFRTTSKNWKLIYKFGLTDSVGVPFNQLQFAPQVATTTQEQPDWLVIKTKEIEKEPSPLNYVWIYQGEWNERTVYYIRDIFSSCLLCEVYYENGEKVAFGEAFDIDSFETTSKNWKIIYEFGDEPYRTFY